MVMDTDVSDFFTDPHVARLRKRLETATDQYLSFDLTPRDLHFFPWAWARSISLAESGPLGTWGGVSVHETLSKIVEDGLLSPTTEPRLGLADAECVRGLIGVLEYFLAHPDELPRA